MPGVETAVLSAASERLNSVQAESVVRKFTWEELSKLNQRHNAHVAVRGKVKCSLNAVRAQRD